LLWQALVSAALGALIYVASLKPDLSFSDKVVGGAVALLNTVLLFGSVAGVITLATQTIPS